jgi:hypothetical protein
MLTLAATLADAAVALNACCRCLTLLPLSTCCLLLSDTCCLLAAAASYDCCCSLTLAAALWHLLLLCDAASAAAAELAARIDPPARGTARLLRRSFMRGPVCRVLRIAAAPVQVDKSGGRQAEWG